MVQIEEQNKVKLLLTEAITSLCKSGLKYETEFCVEGLLGITLDNKDILLVNIKEIVRPPNVMLIEPSPEILNDVHINKTTDTDKLKDIPDITPKRRKKRKSSTVSKRKVVSPFTENKDDESNLLCHSHFSAFPICENLSLNKSRHYTGNLDDIPNLADSEYITLPYEDGEKDHISDTSAHSNVTFPKEECYTLSSLQQSPRISLGEGIPLDIGLGHGDNGDLTAPSLGTNWDDDRIDMPLNLSDVKQESSQKKFNCKECGKQYKTDQNLKKHRCKSGSNSITSLSSDPGITEVSQPLDLTVARPDGTFDDGFDSSMLGIDSDNEGDLSLDNNLLIEQYVCICSRAFSDYNVYIEHVSSCHKAKLTPYKACEICAKYFFSNSGYVKHKRLHLGVYKFHCDICHKGFFDRTHLRAHMDSSHSKVRRYECKHCNKSFFWKHHLKRHLGTCDEAKRHSSLVESSGDIQIQSTPSSLSMESCNEANGQSSFSECVSDPNYIM